MLAARGQENLVQARPATGKALQAKTPSNLQTPRTTNRAALGAKTTNAKAQTGFKDKNNGKLQVFKTPAPNNNKIKPERTVNQLSSNRRSGRSKITVATTESTQADVLTKEVEDDEPDYGYAPPPIVELPDPPIEFGYDQTFPQFQPENMFRGYGQIYYASPTDENGLSLRLKKEEEEYRRYQKKQELELTRRAKEELSRPLDIVEDDFDKFPKVQESNPGTVRTQSAALALGGLRLPSAALKQTASSKSKMNKPIVARPVLKSHQREFAKNPRPLSVSKNTIGFPKAKQTPSIVPLHTETRTNFGDDAASLADDLSDFEFFPADDDEEIFQLPTPE